MTVSGERREALDAAWVEVDRADGHLRPDIVKVQDGFYDRRIVLDSPIVVGPVPEHSVMPDGALAYHYEPCRIPRYRTELVWHRVDPFGGHST